MIRWLKNLIYAIKTLRKLDKIEPYYPSDHADKRNALPLDPGKSDLK